MTALHVIERQHIYGWRGHLPGVWLPSADLTGLKAKLEVDDRANMPSVFNQLKLGACTANADAATCEYDAILDGHDPGHLSRLQVYYGERALEGTLGQGDTGAYGHDGFKVAAHGLALEKDWPYNIKRFQVAPPADLPVAYTLTKQVHAVPQTKAAIKRVLSNQQTVSFGFTVYSSFEDPATGSTGIMPYPQLGESVLGGHQVVAIGYLKALPQYVLCRNSWGTAWGKAGYFFMPWTVITNRQMASDLRTIVRPL